MTTPSEIRRWPIWFISAGLAGLASWLFLRGQPNGLPLDDAYIHLVYARNLAQGLGWCFNPGEPSLGTSSPFWIFLIASRLPLYTPEIAIRLLSVVSFIATTVLITGIAEFALPVVGSDGSSRNVRVFLIIFCTALFAFSGNLLWIAFSGMEAMVFLYLGLLAVCSISSGRPNGWTAIFLGLLLLTRIEGWVLFLVLLGWFCLSALRRTDQPRKNPLAGLWFLIPLIIWSAWTAYTLFHFGRLLPSTMAGKLASNLFNSGLSLRGAALFLWRHLAYFSKWPSQLLVMLACCILGLGFKWFRRRFNIRLPDQGDHSAPLVALVAFWAIGNLVLHALLFRSTAALTPYHYLRYQAPLILALCLGSAWALLQIWSQDFKRIVLATFVITILTISTASSIDFWSKEYSYNVNGLKQSHQAAALWAKDNLPEDARLAGFDIGSLKYFSGRYVIDLGGLTDPAIHPYLREKRVGPYLIKEHATHYLALDRPPEEGLTGVRKDDGTLYHLRELARFDAPDYPSPVLLHSHAVIVYKIE